ncbi:MAG: DUF4293 family protein, partial [Pedobacter sp.]
AKTYNNAELNLLVTGIYQQAGGTSVKLQEFMPLLITTVVTALIAFINIFNFKNRTAQKRVATVNIILIIGLCFWIFQSAQHMTGGLIGSKAQAGVVLPVLGIIFLALGIRGINKDEQLIRSADRLR